MAPGRSAASRTTEQPSADPLRAGLTITGSPSFETRASITVAAPSSRNVSWGRQYHSGVRGSRCRGRSSWRPACRTRSGRQRGESRRRARRAARAPHGSRRPRRPPRAASGSRTTGRSAARSGSSVASTSRSSTSTPVLRRASATRRPERNDTSRSWDNPPARTTRRPAPIARADRRSSLSFRRSSLSFRRSSPSFRRSSLSRPRLAPPSGQVRARAVVPASRGQLWVWLEGTEGLTQLHLGLEHAREAPYALPDPRPASGSRTTAASSSSRSRRRRTRCPARRRPGR